MGTARDDARIFGSLGPASGDGVMDYSIDNAWSARTGPARFASWYMNNAANSPS
jgi:hypothetical protein